MSAALQVRIKACELVSEHAERLGLDPFAASAIVRTIGAIQVDDLPHGDPKYAAWPSALTPELRAILGQMCFTLGPVAHVYQAIGEFIGSDGQALSRRAEDEQAFMLHKMIGYWFADAKTWPDAAIADLDRARAAFPVDHRSYKPAKGAEEPA